MIATYEYVCNDCKHKFEKRNHVHNRQIASCPKCGKDATLVMSVSRIVFDYPINLGHTPP